MKEGKLNGSTEESEKKTSINVEFFLERNLFSQIYPRQQRKTRDYWLIFNRRAVITPIHQTSKIKSHESRNSAQPTSLKLQSDFNDTLKSARENFPHMTTNSSLFSTQNLLFKVRRKDLDSSTRAFDPHFRNSWTLTAKVWNENIFHKYRAGVYSTKIFLFTSLHKRNEKIFWWKSHSFFLITFSALLNSTWV